MLRQLFLYLLRLLALFQNAVQKFSSFRVSIAVFTVNYSVKLL